MTILSILLVLYGAQVIIVFVIFAVEATSFGGARGTINTKQELFSYLFPFFYLKLFYKKLKEHYARLR